MVSGQIAGQKSSLDRVSHALSSVQCHPDHGRLIRGKLGLDIAQWAIILQILNTYLALCKIDLPFKTVLNDGISASPSC